MKAASWSVAARAALGIGLIYWLWRSGIVEWQALQGLAERASLTLTAFLLLVANVGVVSWRLSVLFTARGFDMPLGTATRLNLIGMYFNLFLPGGGGELARLYYAAADAKGRRAEVTALLFLDRAIGLVAILVVPLLLAPLVPDLIRSSSVLRALCVSALVAVTVLVALLAGLVLVPEKVSRILGGADRLRVVAAAARSLQTVQSFRAHPTHLVKALGISMLSHSLSALVVVLLAAATIGPVPWASAGFLSLLGFVANNVPLTPGGLGIGEAAFDALYRLGGIEGGASAVLSWRLLLLGLAPAGFFLHVRGQRIDIVTRAP